MFRILSIAMCFGLALVDVNYILNQYCYLLLFSMQIYLRIFLPLTQFILFGLIGHTDDYCLCVVFLIIDDNITFLIMVWPSS